MTLSRVKSVLKHNENFVRLMVVNKGQRIFIFSKKKVCKFTQLNNFFSYIFNQFEISEILTSHQLMKTGEMLTCFGGNL